MFLDHVILTLSLFTCLSTAFYPLGQHDDTLANRLSGIEYNGPSSRSVLRAPDEAQEKPGIFISIAPFKSSSRYRVRSIQEDSVNSATAVRRDNHYQIVTANSPSQSNSAAVDEDGTDYSYFSQTAIGSKGDEIYLLLDTGSAVTWVMSDSCKSQLCSIHNTFGSDESSTVETGGPSFELNYGTGKVSGSYVNDTISVAGLKVKVPIGLANNISDDFQNYPFDGILGLGRIPLLSSPSSTFLQELASAKLLQANVFGVNLQRNADGTADGEVNFGAPDTTKYHGDLNWTNTAPDHSFWQIPADDILVDGKSAGFGGGSRSAILDTGTSYMLLPPSDAKTFFAFIPGSAPAAGGNGYWTVPCDSKKDIQVVIAGVGYSISPKDYVGAPTGSGSSTCTSHILGLSATGDDSVWLLGDTFLKNVYSVFDADQNRIGLGTKTSATKVGNVGVSGSSSASASTPTSSGSPKTTGGAGGLGLPQAATTATAPSATGSAVSGQAASTSAPANGTGRPSFDALSAIGAVILGLATLLLQ